MLFSTGEITKQIENERMCMVPAFVKHTSKEEGK